MVKGEDRAGMWLGEIRVSYRCQSWRAQRGRDWSNRPDPTRGIAGRWRGGTRAVWGSTTLFVPVAESLDLLREIETGALTR